MTKLQPCTARRNGTGGGPVTIRRGAPERGPGECSLGHTALAGWPQGRGDPVVTRAGRARSAPDLGGGLHDQGELGLLLVDGEVVALDGRGEAALPREAELVER